MKQAEYHAAGVHVYRNFAVRLETHEQLEEWARHQGTNAEALAERILQYLTLGDPAKGRQVAEGANNLHQLEMDQAMEKMNAFLRRED